MRFILLIKCTLLLLLLLPARADDIAADYDAGTAGAAPDPATLGWTYGAPASDAANFTSAGVSPDGATGYNAWRMLDNSAAGGAFITWTKTLTNTEHQKAYANGWNLQARLRVVDPVAANAGGNSVVLIYGNNSQGPVGTARRFILFLDVNASGVLVATLVGGATVTLTGVDPAAHHVHEFDFDGTTKTARYLVDGVEKATGYGGTGTNFNGVQWGTGSSVGKGDGYWNTVRFTIRDVPPPTLVTSPTGGAFNVGDVISLTGAFSGVVSTYQWLKDGNPVPGATTATLTIPFARPGDAGSYVLRAANATGSTDSAAAVVTINPDTVAPTVQSLSASIFASRLRIRFSEPLDEALSLITSAYASTGGLTISAVNKVDDFTYDLAVTPPPAAGTTYTLTLTGLTDESGNPFAPANPTINTTAATGFPIMSNLVAAFHGGSSQAHAVDGVTWNDLSGNENHARSPAANNAVAERRPTLMPASLNGRDTFAFDRTKFQTLAINGPTSTGLNGADYTYFIVAKPTSAPTASYFPNLIRHQSNFNEANWGAYYFAGNASTGNQPSLVASSRNSGGTEIAAFAYPVSFGNWKIISGQASSANGGNLGRDEDRGTDPATVASGTVSGAPNFGSTPIATFIGRSANGNGTNDSFGGEMAEVLIYSGALTADERASVELYLRCRYFAPETAEISIIKLPNGDVEITFGGYLQQSTALSGWNTLNVTSPYVIPAASVAGRDFFRAHCP